ncbi:MAG: response regulator [Pseudomonadota bacterium]
MPDVFDLPPSLLSPPAQPLQGLTLLGVEDSRFASDALRLMCQRSGARLRRADSLLAAQAHLRVYRPDVILIDLGLPDGRGEGLIRQLALAGPVVQRPVILGMSGDPAGRDSALAAGAAGFLDKPLASLARFQASILAHLPDRFLHQPGPDGSVSPDPMALRDDLARAARLVASLQATQPDAPQRRYLAGFLSGLARSAQDSDLAEAALHTTDGAGLARLAGLLRHRIAAGAAL